MSGSGFTEDRKGKRSLRIFQIYGDVTERTSIGAGRNFGGKIHKHEGIHKKYGKDEFRRGYADTVGKDTKARKESIKQDRQDKEGNLIRKTR